MVLRAVGAAIWYVADKFLYRIYWLTGSSRFWDEVYSPVWDIGEIFYHRGSR